MKNIILKSMLALFTLVYIVEVKEEKKEYKTEHEQARDALKRWWRP